MKGKDLQIIIRKSGKSQKELAKKMGMHPSQWTTYFKQESVTSEVLEHVAEILGMSMGQLYGEVSDQDEDVKARNKLLRQTSLMAMQSLLALKPEFSEELLKDNTYEQCVAKLAVQQAYAMLEEFKKKGMDK